MMNHRGSHFRFYHKQTVLRGFTSLVFLLTCPCVHVFGFVGIMFDDNNLMTFANTLGVVVFLSIIAFHFAQAVMGSSQ